MLAKIEIEKTLKDFIVDELFVEIEPDEISLHSNLTSEIGIDSLGITELALFIESRYGVSINDGQMVAQKMKNLEAIIDLIAKESIAC